MSGGRQSTLLRIDANLSRQARPSPKGRHLLHWSGLSHPRTTCLKSNLRSTPFRGPLGVRGRVASVLHGTAVNGRERTENSEKQAQRYGTSPERACSKYLAISGRYGAPGTIRTSDPQIRSLVRGALLSRFRRSCSICVANRKAGAATRRARKAPERGRVRPEVRPAPPRSIGHLRPYRRSNDHRRRW